MPRNSEDTLVNQRAHSMQTDLRTVRAAQDKITAQLDRMENLLNDFERKLDQFISDYSSYDGKEA